MNAIAAYLADQAPGLGVAAYAAAVVADDDVTLAAGGELRAGAGEAVTTNTPFHICSCSKAFTALAFARLVERRMADWDAPVGPIAPEFAHADPWISRTMTFRDLAGMRVGLGRTGIAEWGFRADAPMTHRLSRARFMTQDAPFRDRFSYSNLSYIALALSVERLGGASFKDCLDQLVFRPLGLKGASLETDAKGARPHMPINGRMTAVPELTGDSSLGSARIHLSAEDAGRWVGAMLTASIDAGRGEGGVLNEVFACQSIVRPRLWNDLGLSASGYGLGWTLAEYRGRRVFSHGGGGRGWRAIMVLDPSQRAGAMVMLAHEGGAAEGLALALLDLVAGRTPVTQVPAEAVVQAPPGLDDAPILTGDPTGLYAGDVTGKVRVFRSATGALHFAAEDAPAFDARLDAIDDSRFRLDFNNMAMTAMPGDPPFQLSFHRESGGGASAASTYFGRLRRIAP